MTAWSSTPVRLTVGLVGALIMLGGSVQMGLAVPAEARYPDAASMAGLDYTAIGRRVSPLSEEFIAQALGRDLPLQAAAAVSSPTDATASSLQSAAEPASASPSALPAPADPAGVLVHPPTNDRFDEAVAVSGVPFSGSTDGTGAGRQAGEPADCAPVGGTLWYRYNSPTTEGLVASTAGTRGTVVLGVFSGRTLQDLRLVGCDTGVTGEAAVPFTAAAGQTYYFQVSAPAGGSRVVFNLDGRGVTREVGPGGGDVALSADGRWVAFPSDRSDLVEGDDNGARDVFVRDMVTGEIERVSVASDGTEGNGDMANGLDISDDGRFVGFFSHATNLDDDPDTNDWPDVFVHDRFTGETTRVSVWSDGSQGTVPLAPDEMVWAPIENSGLLTTDRTVSLSADGRMVAFGTVLTLEERDRPRPPGVRDQTDVYVHDRGTGETSLAGLSQDGRQPNDHTWFPALSGDGRMVSFRSFDDSLTAGDANVQMDIFVRDLTNGTTERVSVSSAGEAANDISYKSALSFDGRIVAFASAASNLVANDTNGLPDVFVHDRDTGRTERVSVSSAGAQQQVGGDAADKAYNGQPGAAISHDGRFVAFDSPAPNLAPGDERTDLPYFASPGSDMFVRDRVRGTTVMVSVGTDGRQGNGPSREPAISGDGRHVGFFSNATDLTQRDAPPPEPFPPGGMYVHTLGTRIP